MTGARFRPLPRPDTADGKPRLVGVELEFGGLAADAAADVLHDQLGGSVEPAEPDRYTVTGTPLGDFEVELDTALKADGGELERLGRDLVRPVIPVEVVCPPVGVDDLPRIEELVTGLARKGAAGTSSGPLRAFGMHFNIACVSTGIDDLLPVLRAFAFLEDWLRETMPIDFSRRVLPFIDPYPRAFLDALAGPSQPADLDALARLYLHHNPTRNRALDMTTIIALEHEDQICRALGKHHSVSARPTFHYRLPDSGLDTPGWSIADEWNRWVMVERVAEDTALTNRLAADWRAHRDSWTTVRTDWRRQVARRLAEAGLTDGEGA